MASFFKQDWQAKHSAKIVISALVLTALLAGFIMVKGRMFWPDVQSINANPAVLNKRSIINSKLPGLKISNVHIVGMTLENVDAEKAVIKNVTFENCTFTRVFMLYSHFENVAFKNCNIQNKGNPEELLNNTIFARSVMTNVLFENTRLHNVDMTAIEGRQGYVFFRNMREVYPPGGVGNILSGGSLHIRVVDSDINLASFNSSNKKNASFYAKNSKFKDSFIKSDLMYVENCDFTKGSLTAYQTMVIKDSTLRRITTVPHKTAYLLNNIYENKERNITDQWGDPIKPIYRNSRLYGEPDSQTYVVQKGKQKELAHLNFREGNITVQDVKFFNLAFFQDKDSPPAHEINLRNVEILNWSDWENLHILGGKWENVKINGPILVNDTKIENVQAYKLTFPKGEPWEKEGDFVFDVTKSSKPFEWEEIKVPTPEDLGLEWWPMEPGYHPEK